MSTHVGAIVWCCEWEPGRGPHPAVVLGVYGNALDLHVLGEGGDIIRRSVTPWADEDGTKYGWLAIPDDKQIPADLFEEPAP